MKPPRLHTVQYNPYNHKARNTHTHLGDVRVPSGRQDLAVGDEAALGDRVRQLNQLDVRLGDCHTIVPPA